ncbi:MAG: LamG domain-containing protein [Steroidobacteraceae bacterium]
MKRFFDFRAFRLAALAALSVVALAACGGGADTTENPVTDPGSNNGSSYSGPPPATGDIQAFKVSLWENIHGDNRCGGCHNAGGQAPNFARSDDVNLAYQAAQSIVDLSNPSQSRMVTKVGGGHNCWLADAGACAEILTGWIEDWAAFSSSGGGRAITLQPPTERDPGQSKRFPTTAPSQFNAVHTLLTTYCSNCHAPDAGTPQAPYFAVADIDDSYEASKIKMNLDDPSQSRFVLRLGTEFHNCWSNCESNATDMRNAIQAMADAISPTQIDSSLVLSKALTLFEGTVAAGGNRYDANVIALYEFKTMTGSVAFDTSGVDPAIDLNLSQGVTWVGGWGINIPRGSKAQGLTAASRKLRTRIGLTGEYSIEAWVIPGNVTQEDASIISYSGGLNARNFALGQTLYNYDFFARSSATGSAGTPALSTADADEDLQAALQHVVVTFSPVEGRRIYVNGVFTGDVDDEGGGTIGSWDDSFALVLGNDAANNRPWTGVVRMLAVHDRVLTPAQIQQNFEVGVGQKYFLLFGVSHLTGVPQSYVLFEASQYDSYSYLFTNPKFISLDPNARPGSIAIRGMRLGINGAEPAVGQAYRTLNTTIADAGYTPAAGFPLSTVGTIIGLEEGPESDEFFLCFDQLGTHQNVCSTEASPTPLPKVASVDGADIGVRTFDEISAMMSSLTGVPESTASVRDVFTGIRQSLPAGSDIQAFLASHQASISQLAIQYCHAMTENTTLRNSFYAPFSFPPSLMSGSYSSLVNPVVDKLMGTDLASQPDPTLVGNELTSLVGTVCGVDGCTTSAEVTLAAKAVCAAALGSAITLVK